MDGKNIAQKDIYRYATVLRKEFKFAGKLNSTACQQAVERAWTAIAKFYDNCKKKIKGKKAVEARVGGERPPRQAFLNFLSVLVLLNLKNLVGS